MNPTLMNTGATVGVAIVIHLKSGSIFTLTASTPDTFLEALEDWFLKAWEDWKLRGIDRGFYAEEAKKTIHAYFSDVEYAEIVETGTTSDKEPGETLRDSLYR